MRPTFRALRTIKPQFPTVAEPLYQIPSLSSVSIKDLPNADFGNGSYHIAKTQFGHWPVYKKVQNTKISTEIKRIKGDVHQFKKDLVVLSGLDPKDVTVNQTAGYVNVKGDVVDHLKHVFDKFV